MQAQALDASNDLYFEIVLGRDPKECFGRAHSPRILSVLVLAIAPTGCTHDLWGASSAETVQILLLRISIWVENE